MKEPSEPKKFNLGDYRSVNQQPLARGGDSFVSKVFDPKKPNERVLKEYLFNFKSPEQYKQILRRYFEDTEKAAKLLRENPNPLNHTIVLGRKKNKIEYVVVPQGSLFVDQGRNDSVYGQEFIHGINLKYLQEEKIDNIPENQKIFKLKHSSIIEIHAYCEKLFAMISKNLGVNFTFEKVNVKPFYDKKNNKVTIFITDLGGNLAETYKSI